MRKILMFLASMLLVMTMLSGCIWPWWEDGGRGRGHGGGRGGGHGERR
jgi:hypothetical protein